jgi:hypothetical protein
MHIGEVIHNTKSNSSTNPNTVLTSNSSNSLIENKRVDYSSLIDSSLVPAAWVDRHYKVIHLIGPSAYVELVERAKKYGRNPQALLATLVSRALVKAPQAVSVA